MRKVKLQMQISIDGYVAGPNGEMDWMIWNWSDDIKEYVSNLTDTIDTILIGRKLYDGMSNHWPAVANNQESAPEDVAFAHTMNATRKVVFSKTLTEATWNNSVIITDPIAESVARLKQQEGKDMIIYGGAELVSGFIAQDLIDEYHLFVNPTVLGKGFSIYLQLTSSQSMKLVKSIPFDCGIVLLHYIPIRS